MASNSGGASTPIRSVMSAPQSPPCATNFLYPKRFISRTQARAMRSGSQPGVVGLPENPAQGRRVYRPDSPRRETCRATSAAADQVRVKHQSQDRQGARLERAEHADGVRRRGDRVEEAMSPFGTEGTFRLPMSAHWARPDVSRTCPYRRF